MGKGECKKKNQMWNGKELFIAIAEAIEKTENKFPAAENLQGWAMFWMNLHYMSREMLIITAEKFVNEECGKCKDLSNCTGGAGLMELINPTESPSGSVH